ncbi:hypothetical protein CSV61_01650 [Sporosarcina sp. P3]|uniref:hypothetical protein n=1 Tax=Sporosarcina sp. P3 TaxID=2048245 RepID=UPI000C17350D|nr:hypothetical protein [Sporosarcina sp. P3]PID23184.1 hypothetical protein CSV61_01650 [Sporosarcina sp. P3]
MNSNFWGAHHSDTQSRLIFIDTLSIQIELMEVNDEPSTMWDYLEWNWEGFQNFVFVVDKIATCLESMAKRVYQLLQSGEFKSVNKGCYVY